LQNAEFEFNRLKQTVETSSDRVSDSERKQREAAEVAQKEAAEAAQTETTKPPLRSSESPVNKAPVKIEATKLSLWGSESAVNEASAKTEATKPPLRSSESPVNEAAVDRPGSPSDDGFYDEARDLLDGLDSSPCDSRAQTPIRDDFRKSTGCSSFSAELKAYQDEP